MAITTIRFGIGGTSSPASPHFGSYTKSEADKIDYPNMDANIDPAKAEAAGCITDSQIESLGTFDPNLQISPHFKLRNLSTATPAGSHNVNNHIFSGRASKKQVIKNLRNLCMNVLEPLYKHFNGKFNVTSAYRGDSRMEGCDTSQHPIGQAADLQFTDIPLKVSESNSEKYCLRAMEVAKLLSDVGYHQIIIEVSGKGNMVLHVGWGGANKRQNKTNTSNGHGGKWKSDGFYIVTGKGTGFGHKVWG